MSKHFLELTVSHLESQLKPKKTIQLKSLKISDKSKPVIKDLTKKIEKTIDIDKTLNKPIEKSNIKTTVKKEVVWL